MKLGRNPLTGGVIVVFTFPLVSKCPICNAITSALWIRDYIYEIHNKYKVIDSFSNPIFQHLQWQLYSDINTPQ